MQNRIDLLARYGKFFHDFFHGQARFQVTGIRVFLKTHAPLTLPGMLSTAGHWDQSSVAM